jgi:hypothetical protein
MKKIFFTIISLLILFNFSFSQTETEKILLHPEDWSYEKIDFPLSFAPEINYKGFEELRFSPGMFKNTSEQHFTYIILMNIHEKVKFSETDVNTLIYNYFNGLCMSYSEKNHLSIDSTKIVTDILKIEKNTFRGTAQLFDVFNKAELISVNINLEVIYNKGKTQIYICVSKQNFESGIWQEMFDVKEKINLK